MTETEAKWKERVTSWRASGKTAEAFSADADYEASTLRYWASRLKEEPKASPSAKAPVAMARVFRSERRPSSDEAQRRDSASELTVVIGSVRIAVGRGFDAVVLREVVAALGGGQ